MANILSPMLSPKNLLLSGDRKRYRECIYNSYKSFDINGELYAGHSSIRTTEFYAKVAEKNVWRICGIVNHSFLGVY